MGAGPHSYHPGSSEPEKREEHWAKFLDQMLVQTILGALGGPVLLWGGADLWRVTQHLPQHPAHPSGLFLMHQENGFSRPPAEREARAEAGWEETGASHKQAEAGPGPRAQVENPWVRFRGSS